MLTQRLHSGLTQIRVICFWKDICVLLMQQTEMFSTLSWIKKAIWLDYVEKKEYSII